MAIMKCLPNGVLAIIPLLFFASIGFAQTFTFLPGNIKHLFALHCLVCRQNPNDSAKLVVACPGININQANFHNCIVEFNSGNLDEAYSAALVVITHADEALLDYAYFLKAKILYYKGLYTAAIEEYLHLLTRTIPSSTLKYNIYTNLGEIYLAQSDFSKALYYFNYWQKLYGSNGDAYSSATICQNIGLCLFNLGKLAEARVSFLKGIGLAKQINDVRQLSTAYANLANFYYAQFDDADAIPCFQQSLAYAKQAGDTEILKDANLNMAVVEENRNRFKDALAYRKQYETLKDSIWNRDNIWKLTRQERKFEAQLNANKIQLLEQQAALRSNELKTRNWQRNTLFVAALALLIIAGLVYNAYRVKAKKNLLITNQKEELALLNKTKDRLYSIVAHDLRSPVHSLKTNLANVKRALAENEISTAQTALGNAQTTAMNTYSLLDNLLHWALNQTGELFFKPEKVQLAVIVKHVCYDYQPLAELKDICIKQAVPGGVFVEADPNSLKIILRNLLDNAIKYTAPGGCINITCIASEGLYCMQLSDTGIGMSEAQLNAIFRNTAEKLQRDTEGLTGTGFGLGLCKAMAEKNKGFLKITSQQGLGTTVEICLPQIV